MTVRMALPAGDLREPIAAQLAAAGFSVNEYAAGSRSYRPMDEGSGVSMRVFRERDIPIQVALGNYDLAVCGLLWVEEFRRRMPTDAVVVLRPYDAGQLGLFVVRATTPAPTGDTVTIVSEFEAIATAFAVAARFPRFRVVPLWGSAVNYPPEDADFAVIAAPDVTSAEAAGLTVVHRLLDSTACLIANQAALRERPLAGVLAALMAGASRDVGELEFVPPPGAVAWTAGRAAERDDSIVRLAIPDGHQQRHTFASLADAGLRFEGYGDRASVIRPGSGIEGLEVKVIRPQDMAQQVALGRFDLAITGRDWLLDHLYQFPTSPARELADLGRAAYNIVAVVDEDLPAGTIEEAIEVWRGAGKRSITVASEYRNIADHYARERHLGRYRIVPIAGASEGFVPEDAEILIEGTETGTTLKANRLRPLDTVFHSTSCLIGGAPPAHPRARALFDSLVERFAASRAVVGA